VSKKKCILITLGLVILIIALFIVFIDRGAEEMFVSDYFTITSHDNFRLVEGWADENERTDFSRSEMDIIHSMLQNLTPYTVRDDPPWVDPCIWPYEDDVWSLMVPPEFRRDCSQFRLLGPRPMALYVTGEEHDTVISFVQSYWGSFASVQVDDGAIRWFTLDFEYYSKMVTLAR